MAKPTILWSRLPQFLFAAAVILIWLPDTVSAQALAPKPHYLGVTPDTTISSTSGVRVAAIDSGSPAEKGGLKVGDIIVKLGSVSVKNAEDLVISLKSANPQRPVELIYLRQGKESRTQVTLEGRR